MGEWYVVWVRTKDEHRFIERLRCEELDVYADGIRVITRQENRHIRGEDVVVDRLLFPGYLFYRTEAPEELHLRVRRYPEYIGILKDDHGFTPLSKRDENIIQHLTNGSMERVDMSVGVIIDGRVHVIKGPLVGYDPYIVKVNRPKKKCELEMVLFGETRRFQAGLDVTEVIE